MTSRRSFLKYIAAVPAVAAAQGPVPAEAKASRIALVIGNNAYRTSPLENASNDARAISDLLKQAEFAVDTRIDATRAGMVSAIEAVTDEIKRVAARQVVFYYAGHAVQLDWRNYLLPVDAEIGAPDDIKRQCIDLEMLLGKLSASADRTFVIILDACRNNPFGDTYQVERKGLSQFDAPPGTLLAYSTSPGSVASDGKGKNGLYTENLVRELAVRGAKVEDALKRVRLNVRLASQGTQIPWETTSLERDLYLFPGSEKAASEAEGDAQLEADVAAWARIQGSKDLDDWVGYLRAFPNGRFAEIAQDRIARLTSKRKQPSKIAGRRRAESAIRIDPGVVPVEFTSESANPYSQGLHPLGRKFSVGDSASYTLIDLVRGATQRDFTWRVTAVDVDNNLVEVNKGAQVWDLMGNVVRNTSSQFSTPRQFVPAEVFVGKKWIAAYEAQGLEGGPSRVVNLNFHITRRERVRVPAGEFLAFRAEGRGESNQKRILLEETIWLIPGLNFPIKHARGVRRDRGGYIRQESRELVSLRQILGTAEDEG